jgi:hypothetical protein
MLTISYSETRTKGTLSTWQRCTLDTKALPLEQVSEMERLTSLSGVLQVDDAVVPADAILEGVHWTLIVEDGKGTHKIIGKSARKPNLPLQDTDPTDESGNQSENQPPNPLNYQYLGELLQFLKPHLKSGFAAES